jgi:hypothetical protein
VGDGWDQIVGRAQRRSTASWHCATATNRDRLGCGLVPQDDGPLHHVTPNSGRCHNVASIGRRTLCRISSERYPTTKIVPQTWSAESFPNLLDATHEDAVCVVRRGKLSVPVPAGLCWLRRSLASRELRRPPPSPSTSQGASTADMMLSPRSRQALRPPSSSLHSTSVLISTLPWSISRKAASP